MRSHKPFAGRKAVAALALLGLMAGQACADDSDSSEMYDYLYGSEVAASPAKLVPSFDDDQGVRPWTPQQMEEMRAAFREREPIPQQPAAAGEDDAIRLWDLVSEPHAPAPGGETEDLEIGGAGVLGTPYDALIHKYAKRYNVSAKLIALQMAAESGFNPEAVSPKGNKGLMQISDALAAQFNVDPYDPESNINVGVLYMSSMLKRYDGDIELALAAYNAGPGAVDKYDGIPPYKETQAYIKRILAKLASLEATYT